jgi:hypothetical protein
MHKGSPDELEFFNNRSIRPSNFQLHFSAYCSKEFSVPVNKNKLSKKDGELHIAYIGFFFNDKESIRNISAYFEDILSQKLHLHVYMNVKHIPKNQAEAYFNEFLLKFVKSEYFHIHEPLGPKEIIKEISKYDYSFWFSSILNIPELKYHIGNKFSSYFEAGIPMIYSKESLYIDKLMNKYGLQNLGFSENFKDLRKNLEKLDYKELQKKTVSAREDFDMDKNFPRLEKFIEEVAVSRKTYPTSSVSL